MVLSTYSTSDGRGNDGHDTVQSVEHRGSKGDKDDDSDFNNEAIDDENSGFDDEISKEDQTTNEDEDSDCEDKPHKARGSDKGNDNTGRSSPKANLIRCRFFASEFNMQEIGHVFLVALLLLGK